MCRPPSWPHESIDYKCYPNNNHQKNPCAPYLKPMSTSLKFSFQKSVSQPFNGGKQRRHEDEHENHSTYRGHNLECLFNLSKRRKNKNRVLGQTVNTRQFFENFQPICRCHKRGFDAKSISIQWDSSMRCTDAKFTCSDNSA